MARWARSIARCAAWIADAPDVLFTTPHFDGYPAVLVRSHRVGPEDLAEASLARAPKRLAKAYIDELR